MKATVPFLMLGSTVTHSILLALNGVWLVFVLVFVFGFVSIVWGSGKQRWEQRRVLRDGSFEWVEGPDPLPAVLEPWRGGKALATTSGRRVYVLQTFASQPNGKNEFGDPYYDSFVVAFTKVDWSFPWPTGERYERRFVAKNGWAAYYEEEPASIVKVAGDLDRIVSSVEHPTRGRPPQPERPP